MQKLLFVVTSFATCSATFGADSVPALQWVKTIGGAGNQSVASAAVDSHGSTYIVGSTTSLNFPVASAGQSIPGGSPLARVNLVTGAASRLFPENLPSIAVAAASASEPGALYAGSGSRVLKSTDAGATWTVLYQFPSSVNVAGVAVHPTVSTTLYAGTSTIGVQRSKDGGVTWTAVNNGLPAQADGSFGVRSVWVDPSAANVIFASSGFGLMRSADGGDSWVAAAGGGPYSPLAFDPVTAGTVYYGNGNDVLKSTDDGATFARVTSLPNQAGLITLAVDAAGGGALRGVDIRAVRKR